MSGYVPLLWWDVYHDECSDADILELQGATMKSGLQDTPNGDNNTGYKN